jgi:glycosyltransferase involved in cell wall biosynthesis
VFTFHEFLAICDAHGHMVRRTDGSLCTHASPVRCHQCFPDRSPEIFFTRKLWMQSHLAAVDVFTVPSRFMIKLYADWGIQPDRIVHISNGQQNYNAVSPVQSKRMRRNRFGFFGQLVDVKGVWVLLRAVELLRADGFTDFSVEINGDNIRYASEKRRSELEAFQAQERARPAEQQIVSFNGSYHIDALPRLMARVDWCVVPSAWWEAFGLVISEAWMFRRPVIVSNVGGMAERVKHETSGLHFAVGDARSLAETMRRACTERGLWDKLVASLPQPPSRELMVDGFARIYREREMSAGTASAA